MNSNTTQIAAVSRETLQRLPEYLNCLKAIEKENIEFVSASEIGKHFGLTDVQVKDDLDCIGCERLSETEEYSSHHVVEKLVKFLDYDNTKDAVLVGAGRLGKTLLGYDGFENYGLNIAVAFDIDFNTIGTSVNGKQILSVENMKNLCERLNIHIGIITVPARSAQQVCNLLIKCGVFAIWNFSPIKLDVPDGIIVQNENMASSLAVLSNRLANRLTEGFSCQDKQQI